MSVFRGIASFVLLFTLLYSVFGLDEESAKEKKCFQIKKTVPVDVNWLGSQKVMYFSVMSRLDLYRTAADLTGRDFKDISEDELYYEGCMKFGLNSDGTFSGTGFNGVSKETSMKPLDPALERFEFGDEEDDEGYKGICYSTMTDNKTYSVVACCSNGNEMHWGAISTVKSLPKSTVKKIYEHAEYLGFSREHFTAIRYDSCENKNKKQEL